MYKMEKPNFLVIYTCISDLGTDIKNIQSHIVYILRNITLQNASGN